LLKGYGNLNHIDPCGTCYKIKSDTGAISFPYQFLAGGDKRLKFDNFELAQSSHYKYVSKARL